MTISACASIGWEQYIKLNPPRFAKAMANVSFETDCIIADVKGTFRHKEGSVPFSNLTKGVLKEILSG
jgi:MinD-like ATPase involved in chromosome partitioning or flagellar assembly